MGIVTRLHRTGFQTSCKPKGFNLHAKRLEMGTVLKMRPTGWQVFKKFHLVSDGAQLLSGLHETFVMETSKKVKISSLEFYHS